MFDFAWTEIALIGVVALVAIGPKDLPIAIKTVAGFVKKARRMAAEFQTHVDELVREADLHEVRDQIKQIRNFDIRGEIEKAVDADGSMRAAINSNPLSTPPATTPTGTTHDTAAEPVAAAPGDPALLPAGLPAEHSPTAPFEVPTHAAPVGQSRNVSETRVMERPAATVVVAGDATPPASH